MSQTQFLRQHRRQSGRKPSVSKGGASRLPSDRDEMYSGTRTARRSFGTRRDDVRAQDTKPREEPKVNDIESAAGDPRGEILRELHNALDSLETHLKQIPVSECVRPDPIDIIAQLRRQIIAQTTDRQNAS